MTSSGRPSFGAGWKRARSARRVIVMAWLVEVALSAPLALGLALGLTRQIENTRSGSDYLHRLDSEALARWFKSWGADPLPLALLFVATLLALAAWNVVWQAGLALEWEVDSRASARRAIAAALLGCGPFVALAALGTLLELAVGGGVFITAAPLRALGRHAPWQVMPALIAVQWLVAAAAFLFAHSVVQRARWAVADGAPALQALARGVVATVRTPLRSLAPLAAWCAWTLLLTGAWLVARTTGSFTTSTSLVLGHVLLLAVGLGQTWGRASLVLAFAPDVAADERR